MKIKNLLIILSILGVLMAVQAIIPNNKVEASYKKNINKATISSVPTQIYSGAKITPNITVKYKGKKLKKNKDYKITYSNNALPGTGKIKIRGIGKYNGSKTKTFKIKLTNVNGLEIKDLDVANKAVKLKWNKTSKNITGYKIYRIINGKYSLIKTISNKNIANYTHTGLKNDTMYTYKIRAYKTVGKKTYYGDYSNGFVSAKIANLTYKK